MRTRAIVSVAIAVLLAAALSGAGQQSAEQLYKSGLYEEEVGGDLQKAIGIFQEILKRFPANLEVAAKAQLRIGFCYEKLGIKEAERAFQKVIDNYPGEAQAVRVARDSLARLRQARPAGEKAARGAIVRRIMYWNDLSINGTVSPDERYISITDWQTGDLAIKDIVTGKERRLTNKGVWDDAHPGYAFESVWSPDSQRVAYTWVNANNETELHEVGITDPRPRTVRGEEKGVWLALIEWSADGQSILAKGISGEADLRLISPADGATRIVKSFPGKDFPLGHASLSPDGKTIVYSRPANPDGQTSDLFLLTVADGREIPLVQHPAHDEFLSWLPDGGGILFASDRSGRFDAWVLPVEAGTPQGSPTMVKGTFGAVHPLLMTSDGRFYYSTAGAMRTIYSAALDPQTGRLVDPPAREPLTYEGNNFWPAWSPDGKTLAYSSMREMARRTGVLCLYRADTKELREVRTERRLGGPRWTEDGRKIILQGLQVDGGGIYQLDLATEEVTPLVSEGELFAALMRPDRKMVVYGLGNSKEKIHKVMVRDLVTGQDTELARTPLANNTAAFSPDGRRLALLLRLEESLRVLKVMGFPGGTPKEILRFKQGGAFIISLAWSPDGRFIYFSQSPGDDRNWDLWRVPAEGGQAQDLGLRTLRFEGLSFHPDGRRITFASIPPEFEFPQIWVMENFLPPAPPAPKEDETGFRVRKVWDKADPYFLGAPSPDGKYLTYADDYLGLGIRNLATGQNRLLLQNKSWAGAEYCYNSVFSPDGSRVAYICQIRDRLTQLRIVDRDGTSTRVLRDGQDRTDYVPFAWTPDGKAILTQFAGEGLSGVAFVSAEDGSVGSKKVFSFKVPWAERMRLSPDGRYVAGAYTPSEDSSAKDIFILPVEGDHEAAILEHPADEAVIGWSPDGGRVLFTSDRTGSVGIWAVRTSGGKAQGEPELLRANLGSIRPLGLTGDGKLYYGIATGSSDVFIAPMDPSTGMALGQPVKAVHKYETYNASPDWSPDGQFLACHSTRGRPDNDSPALLIRSLRTDEVRELIPKTPGGRFAPYYLRWSPDGRSIIGTGRDDQGHVGALLSVDVRTGEGRVLARADAQLDGKGNIIAPDWSSDGKSIHFVRIGNDFRRICNLDLETGVEREIGRFDKASGPFWLASSPDGKQLAFYSEGKLRILSRDGAASREPGVAGDGSVLAWMPDGKTILFGKSQDSSQDMVELWSIPAAGGEPRKTGLSMSRLLVPRVSPDGKHIAFMASDQPSKSEVWFMENFLPGGKVREKARK